MCHVSPVVQLSIDLGLRSNQTALIQHQQLETVTQNLLAWVTEYRLTSTWAFPCPAGSDIVRDLQRLDVPQEIALMVDSTWGDADTTRGTLARELARHMNAVRQQGLELTSLAVRHSDVTDNLDLIAKQRISMVRVGVTRGRRRQTIETIRHGLWRVMPTMSFPASGGLARLNWLMAQHRLGRPKKRQTTEHVRVSAADLLDANRSTWRTLDQFLRQLSKLVDAGHVRMQTLSEAAGEMQPTRTEQPARSILRPAA